MKKTLGILCGMFVLLNVTACNTVHGFGQDVQKTGQAIERGADK